MAHHRRHPLIAQRVHQPQCIAYQVEKVVLTDVAVIARITALGHAVATLVRRHHVITRLGQRQHHLAPAERQLRKAVQQQHTLAARLLKTGLQNVHVKTITVVNLAGANTGRQLRQHGSAGSVAGRAGVEFGHGASCC